MPTFLRGSGFRGCLHLGAHHSFLKLCVGVKHLREVADCHHRLNGFLVDVPRLLKVTTADIVISQRVPQDSNLERHEHRDIKDLGFHSIHTEKTSSKILEKHA